MSATAEPRPVRFVSFEGHSKTVRLAGPSLHMERLEGAQQAAADWMNEHPEIEIITIRSHVTDLLAIVTVWYRS